MISAHIRIFITQVTGATTRTQGTTPPTIRIQDITPLITRIRGTTPTQDITREITGLGILQDTIRAITRLGIVAFIGAFIRIRSA